MAEVTWVTTDGNWQSAASWSDGVGCNGKVAVFDGTSQLSAVTGLDLTAGNVPSSIIVKHTYRGSIGGPGNALRGDVFGDSGVNVIRGEGRYYLSPAIASDGFWVIDSVNTLDCVHFGTTGAGAGAARLLAVKSGALTLEYGANATHILVCGPSAYLTVESDADGTTYPAFFQMTDGTATIRRYTTAATRRHLIISGGSLTHTGIWGAATYVNQDGGHIVYNPSTAPGAGDKPIIVTLGGLFDASQYNAALTFNDFIQGPNATVYGTIVTGTFTYGQVDLSEEYPS